jgi:thiol-disulfide isomerase/thioredoxin
MRHSYIIIIAFCVVLFNTILIGNAQTENKDYFKNGIIFISGQIKDIKTEDNKTIFLSTTDILSGKESSITLQIDSFGSFEKTLPIFYGQELKLEYQNRIIRLLVKQSDSLNLIIGANEPAKEIKISGNGSIRNMLFHKYIQQSRKISDDYYQAIEENLNKELEYSIIVSECDKVHSRLDSLNKNFISTNNPDELLLNWISAEKKTICCNEFINYGMSNNMRPAIILKKEGVFKEADLNMSDFYSNEYYSVVVFNYFANNLLNENKFLLNKLFTYLKNDQYNEAINILADSIYYEYKSIAKDIVLYHTLMLFSNDDFIKMIGKQSNIDKYKKYLVLKMQSDFVKIQVLEYSNETVKIERPEITSSLDLLSNLIQKYKGMVLYIDISATWCSPCMFELPKSIVLHEDLKNKAVEFIYLFAKSNKNDWEKLSLNLGLKGENLLLTNDEYITLLTNYKIDSGFPQFLLIDKNGELVTKTAKRPSDPELKKDIIKLLEN